MKARLCILFIFLLAATGMSYAAGARIIMPFDAGWRFLKGDAKGAEATAFDDSKWRTLDLPHDWSIEGPFDVKNPTGGSGGFLPACVGWYRKPFTLPKEELAKRILEGLVPVFHQTDPSRPVTQKLFRPNVSHDYDNGLADLLDVIGTNYRDLELLAAYKTKPGRKIIGTEQRHDLATWLAARNHPEHAGQFLWSGIDYLGESLRWPVIVAGSGLLDLDICLPFSPIFLLFLLLFEPGSQFGIQLSQVGIFPGNSERLLIL
jgi:hypothetical protein